MAGRLTKKPQKPEVLLEDIRLIFRNFSGAQGIYNREGDRNFCIILPPDVAERMAKDGYNIKELKPKEEGDEPAPYLQVKVGYRGATKPQVILITSGGRTSLTEDMIGMLDTVEIETADIKIGPHEWIVHEGTPREDSGTSAYLRALYVKIIEDPLEKKWLNPVDSALGSLNFQQD